MIVGFHEVGLVRPNFDRKKPHPPGGFPISYVPSSRTVRKRTPLEEPGTDSSRGVLLLTVLDEGGCIGTLPGGGVSFDQVELDEVGLVRRTL